MPDCLLCGGDIVAVRPYTYRTRIFRRIYPSATVFRCARCGLTQAKESVIKDADLTDYYRSTYRNVAKITSNDTEESQNYYKARATALRLLLDETTDGELSRVFEVGAGYGYNLAAIRDAHPNVELFTDELDDNLQTAMGARQASMDGTQYDAIIMSHVVEHFKDPGALISRACNSLRKGGVLIIEVPNDATGESSVTPCDEPHVSFFNSSTLRNLLAKEPRLTLVKMFVAGPTLVSKHPIRRTLIAYLSRYPSILDALKRLRPKREQPKSAPIPDFSTPNDKGIFLRASAVRT